MVINQGYWNAIYILYLIIINFNYIKANVCDSINKKNKIKT